jgi:pyruvate formate lyase activating enzyme
LLDAVVFSGGEPTLQGGLYDALSIVRQMGYRVGLHTAGVAPRRLEALIPRCDWIAMDVKAPFEDYEMTTARRASGGSACASEKLILDSGIDHEFRTTVHPALLAPQALLRLAAVLADAGVRRHVLQEFRAQGCANAAMLGATSYLDHAFLQTMKSYLPSPQVRRA